MTEWLLGIEYDMKQFNLTHLPTDKMADILADDIFKCILLMKMI